MQNLQKIAEAVHADFVAQSIKELEEIAAEGKFTHTIHGSFAQLRALANQLRRDGYWYELSQGLTTSYLSIQWHSTP